VDPGTDPGTPNSTQLLHLMSYPELHKSLQADMSQQRGPETLKFFLRLTRAYMVKVKVKQSRYRPGVAQRVPGS
jgi:hypothetical protein